MKQQLLLLKDVDALGKKGEIVTAKPGYVRNFLIPQGFAVVASANTLRKQERLKEERAKQGEIDRKESEELAGKIDQHRFEIRVKVDPEGHMYGSVSAGDIFSLFQELGLNIEKKFIQVTRPIKQTGVHKISLRLKEGVLVQCDLHILAEGAQHVAASASAAVEEMPQAPQE